MNQPIFPRNLKLDMIKFSILDMAARDVLDIIVCTVAYKYAFNTGGRVVSPHCCQFHPETIEDLMYSQDWLKKETQDIKTIVILQINIIVICLLILCYCFHVLDSTSSSTVESFTLQDDVAINVDEKE